MTPFFFDFAFGYSSAEEYPCSNLVRVMRGHFSLDHREPLVAQVPFIVLDSSDPGDLEIANYSLPACLGERDI
jgi:hypothetical protein